MRSLPTSRRLPPMNVLAASAAVAALLSACGDDGSTTAATVGGSTTPEVATVEIERSRYAPADVTIARGDTVDFVNRDPFDHTVTAATDTAAGFDSGAIGQDETFSQSFEEPGTYRYFCEIHPTMRASVTVR